MHCAKTMHERVREVMLSITSPTGAGGTAVSPPAGASAAHGPEASSSGAGGEAGGTPGAADSGPEDMDQGGSGPSGAAAHAAAAGARGPSPTSEYADATPDLHEAASRWAGWVGARRALAALRCRGLEHCGRPGGASVLSWPGGRLL